MSDQPGAGLPPDTEPAVPETAVPTPAAGPPAPTAYGPEPTTDASAPTAPTAPTTDAPLAAGLTTGLADGEWHRLHPATPLLRGGIALIAILWFVINSFRETLIEMFTGNGPRDEDPVTWVFSHGYAGLVLLGIAVGLIVFIAGFYVSWRMHTFRITNEVVEVRSGILFRTNRRGRLDRIQGINIVRPLIARIFGAAKLEVNVAGEDANVQLSYLASRHADDLRRDILRLASGTQAPPVAAGQPQPHGGVIDQRVSELLAPELDPSIAPPESVVKMNTGRLIGSILLNDTTVVFVLLVAGAGIATIAIGEPFLLFAILPMLIGIGSYLVSRFTKSLRYSIAGTPDGVRVGFGLFTTSNETLPPGRIHSIQVSQPLLWRMTGWWEIKVNRASKSSTQGANGQQNTTILPVGNLDDVMKVLGLLLPTAPVEAAAAPAAVPLERDAVPDAVDAATALTPTAPVALENDLEPVVVPLPSHELLFRGMTSKGGDDGFVNSPRRAVALRWFSWRRNGYAFSPGVVLFRKGRIWRELIIVPEPRVQSVALHQGPLRRRLDLASITLHTVAGPITASLGAVAATDAVEFFETASRSIVASASTDTSHRWRSGEVGAANTAEVSAASSVAVSAEVSAVDTAEVSAANTAEVSAGTTAASTEATTDSTPAERTGKHSADNTGEVSA